MMILYDHDHDHDDDDGHDNVHEDDDAGHVDDNAFLFVGPQRRVGKCRHMQRLSPLVSQARRFFRLVHRGWWRPQALFCDNAASYF